MSEAVTADKHKSYAVILIRREIDRFDHNILFASELRSAFGALSITIHVLDYLVDHDRVLDALSDSACQFFVCSNGFGSELRVSTSLTVLYSAFRAHGKLLFDFMHDCPAHESMAHQVGSKDANRNLLMTDYGHAAIATDMGFPVVRFVPSITFPGVFGSVRKPFVERDIPVLIPMGVSDPALFQSRYHTTAGSRGRVYKAVFEEVTERAIADWRIDPIVELRGACREAGLMLDFNSADGRFLLSTVLDFTKFSRRRRLLHSLSHLAITVMTDRDVLDDVPNSNIRFVRPHTATKLLELMGEARCVVCPTPHMTGYHERVLSAFTAGAVVISSPNRVLEVNFVHGRDLMFFQQEADLTNMLPELLSNVAEMQSIAERGNQKALALFPPIRFAETVVSLLALHGR
jgi:hypothetical protein